MENPNDESAHRGSHDCVAKSDLAEAVAETLNLPHLEAAGIVNVIFGSIARAVHRGDKVKIRGFGCFGSRKRGQRRGRNPLTGVAVAVPAKRVAMFMPSKQLLRDLNRI